MNGLYLIEQGNGYYALQLPNGFITANIVMPNDNNDNADFDSLFNISKLLGAKWGLIDGNVKELKHLKLPDSIGVVKGNNKYSIYLNRNIQVADVYIPSELISAMVVVGISILLEKRWRGFIKQQTINSSLTGFRINHRIG